MRQALCVMLSVLASSVVWHSPALASDGEHALSVSAGYGTYVVPDHSPHGGVLDITYERGFSDALSWRVAGGGGVYYGSDQVTYSGHATFGFTYLLDVLRYVPYVELGAGAIAIAGGDAGADVSPLLQVGLGLDVLRSRTFSYGVRIQFESLLQETSYFTAGARATWRWGFF